MKAMRSDHVSMCPYVILDRNGTPHISAKITRQQLIINYEAGGNNWVRIIRQ